MTRLREKIRTPYSSLAQNITRLRRLQLASDALRRTARFILLSRRLDVQMKELRAGKKVDSNASIDVTITTTTGAEEVDREGNILTKAALTVAELGS